MPRVSELFKAERLKGSDLTGPGTVIIKSALIEKPGYNGGVEQTIDVELNGTMRFVKVTPQLAADIVAILGDDESLNWINKAITIYPKEELIKSENKMVLVIRASAAKDVPASVVTGNGYKTPPKPRTDLNDDIPL